MNKAPLFLAKKKRQSTTQKLVNLHPYGSGDHQWKSVLFLSAVSSDGGVCDRLTRDLRVFVMLLWVLGFRSVIV